MQRHPALHDLSRDHFFALQCAREIRLACESGDPHRVAEAGRALAHLWEADLAHHFREEEEVLLPLLARHGPLTERPEIRRMLDDHAWFRDRLSGPPPDRLGLAEIGQRLHDHARLEEREIFPMVERVLTEADLDDCARRSAQFRLRLRGPDALGPHRMEP